jgi:hypothetical protein
MEKDLGDLNFRLNSLNKVLRDNAIRYKKNAEIFRYGNSIISISIIAAGITIMFLTIFSSLPVIYVSAFLGFITASLKASSDLFKLTKKQVHYSYASIRCKELLRISYLNLGEPEQLINYLSREISLIDVLVLDKRVLDEVNIEV